MLKRLAENATTPTFNGPEELVKLHPAELMALLEDGWRRRVMQTHAAGHPFRRSEVPGIAESQQATLLLAPIVQTSPNAGTFAAMFPAMPVTPPIPGIRPPAAQWDHLIYAYMIENTRIYEIFRRVVHEFLHGEKLGTPTSPDTQLWLRNTEELFYQDSPSFSIATLSSHIRPDLGATRRNAYWRMFAMEPNHGTEANAPYPYIKADAANNNFVATFEELLREVWIGHININTTSGARPTDDAKILELAHKLHDMLITRRQGGNLSREEFFFVAMMSWFHLTVNHELQIIRDLRAQGAGPEERLFKIAQAVGVPAHGLSRSYFEIAETISVVLIAIETGTLHTSSNASLFYDPALSPLAGLMNTIIMHWSLITGRDMKAGRVATTK